MPETKKPLSVAIASVTNNNNILLIKRKNEPYAGKWAFPGGKIEHGEHISEAAIRELLEETGIKAKFEKHLGCVSEHLIEEGKISNHFILHVCELTPKTLEIKEGSEGKVKWLSLDNMDELEKLMVSSDFSMIKTFVKNRKRGYFECIIEKKQNDYFLRKFE